MNRKSYENLASKATQNCKGLDTNKNTDTETERENAKLQMQMQIKTYYLANA